MIFSLSEMHSKNAVDIAGRFSLDDDAIGDLALQEITV